jgi:hypothetical protein
LHPNFFEESADYSFPMRTILLALMLAGASFQTAAQPAALVEGVQMPAWVERDGSRTPLQPGMQLRAGDRLITGAGSRLAVRLTEGSIVRLGESGTLQLVELEPAKELFKAALRVIEGAFRFTTAVAAKGRRREASISLATVTVGIRGTDVWGRSRQDTQVVCLIEGAVEVGAQGEQPVTMSEPRQFYRRVAGQTQPIGFVEQKQLDEWASETEIETGKGAARRDGRWQVRLAAADNQADALAVYDQLRAAGYPAEIRPTRDGERQMYVVRIRSLPSQAEAQALAAQLRGKFGVGEPAVSR